MLGGFGMMMLMMVSVPVAELVNVPATLELLLMTVSVPWLTSGADIVEALSVRVAVA